MVGLPKSEAMNYFLFLSFLFNLVFLSTAVRVIASDPIPALYSDGFISWLLFTPESEAVTLDPSTTKSTYHHSFPPIFSNPLASGLEKMNFLYF
jgi:hypothetical protein